MRGLLVVTVLVAACSGAGPTAEAVIGNPYLPSEVAGISLELRTAQPAYYASPPSAVPSAGPDIWVTILSSLGKSWADLRFVGVSRNEAKGLSVYATQVNGVASTAFLVAYESAMGATLGRPSITFERQTVGSRYILVSTVGVLYVYAVGDVLYEISSESVATAEAALATLP
jgi:hypothetical protein